MNRWPGALDALVPLSMDHAGPYAALLADERVHPFVIENGPYPADRIAQRIALKQAERERGGSATWAILDEDGAFVGYVSIHPMRSGWVALSYAVAPQRWRRGHASRAVDTLVRALFAQRAIEGVEASTHLENLASAALLTRIGFTEVEPTRDPPRRVFRRIRGAGPS